MEALRPHFNQRVLPVRLANTAWQHWVQPVSGSHCVSWALMLRASRSAFASRLHSLHTSSSCLAEALAGKEEILTDKDTYTNEDALTASNAVQPLDPSDPRVREITVPNGIAFPGDLRSSSGLGLGDKLTSHTSKWQQVQAELRNLLMELSW